MKRATIHTLCLLALPFAVAAFTRAQEAPESPVPAAVVPIDGESVQPAGETEGDAENNAAVVELGEGREYLPPIQGPWVLPAEEPGPRAVTQSVPSVRPGDPEWFRAPVAEPDTELAAATSVHPAPAPRSNTRPGDPETPRQWPDDQEPPAPVSAAPVGRTSGSPRSDEPRFASGDGLDSEAAEVVAEIALAERKQPPGAAVAEPPVSPAPDGAAGAKPTESAAIPGDAAPTQPDGQPPTAQPADPQKRFEELIAQIRRNQALLNKTHETAPADRRVRGPGGQDTGVEARDPRARLVMENILRDTPLGTVSGTISDAATPAPAPARVRITDISDTTVQAPLPQGFWCNGRFEVEAFSGPARVEISRGRFYPQIVQGVQVRGRAATPFTAASVRPGVLDFSARGWHLADLDIALRVRPGERPLWLGKPPELADLVLAARAEGVRILGVPVPWGAAASPREVEALAASAGDVVVLPVFPGPRHAFFGCAMGLGVTSWQGLPPAINAPETPLREAFEDIRARGGLGVYRNLAGGKTADIRRDILLLFPRLEQSNFYGAPTGAARLYAANELPFDTVAGPAYDAFCFDGSPSAERLWFNLLNQGYKIAAIGAGGGSLEAGRVPYGQTLVHVDGAPDRAGVLDALKNGRTGISFGPAVFCRVLERDKGPGAVLPADGRRLTLQVQAYASMAHGMQLDKLEIIRNGQVVHSQTASEGEAQINNLTWTIGETATAWYMVRVSERCNAASPAQEPGRAWTGPLFFRDAVFAPPAPAVSRIKGRLQRGPNPVAGTVTVLAPGQPPRQVETDRQGNFKLEMPAAGSLIFEAPGCEPLAKRVFEHERVQRALGALQAEREGPLLQMLERPSLLRAWRLLLSDLDWPVTLQPTQFVSP
jgi:hypothetical protein